MRKTTAFKALSILALGIVLPFALVSCSMGGAGYDGVYSSPMAGAYDGSAEEYTEIVENAFVSADELPTSYFSIDANTASYPNIRSFINNGQASGIPKDAVRIEEMLNYFEYDYDRPEGDDILALTSALFDNPYNPETKLMTLGLAAKEVDMSGIRNNIVFLIDTSGSMESSDKLGLVQSAFKLLAENLGDNDRVSIVTYAGSETVALDGAFGYEKDKIKAVISDLRSGGSTAGAAGINKAYELAAQYFIDGGNNRVILATDGDFNVGISDLGRLEKLISEKRETGVYFSAYLFGHGNIKSEKMERLALAGNGTYSYVDSVSEAKRVFVECIGGSLVTVAKDVKAGITFNSNYIAEYRLVGYENKLLSAEEFEDENTDAGELGSGHTLTVVYEIKLKDNEIGASDSLASVDIRYKSTENSADAKDENLTLTLSVLGSSYTTAPSDTELFVASVVEFGLILRDSQYKADADIEGLIERLELIDMANRADWADFKKTVKAYGDAIAKGE